MIQLATGGRSRGSRHPEGAEVNPKANTMTVMILEAIIPTRILIREFITIFLHFWLSILNWSFATFRGSSYTGSDSDDDDEIEDETLRAIRDAQRAKELRNKFEKWEKTQDAQDQARQIMIHDENGECLETAGNLKARFEALQLRQQEQTPPPQRKFQPRRFK